MTTIRVDAIKFRDLVRAAARALEETTEVEIDPTTLDDLHLIVNLYHPEALVRIHLANTRQEVIHDSDI